MKKIIILGVLLSPVLVMAKGLYYLSDDGDRFKTVISKGRAVMTTENSKSYMINATTIKRGKLQLVLTRDCKAKSNLLGNGTWHWANGGVFVQLDYEGYEREITFPRQELSITKDDECWG